MKTKKELEIKIAAYKEVRDFLGIANSLIHIDNIILGLIIEAKAKQALLEKE